MDAYQRCKITVGSDLYRLKVRDPAEPGYYLVLLRDGPSPHRYEWRSLLTKWDGQPIEEESDQRYEMDFLKRECFTLSEVEAIESYLRPLGLTVQCKRVELPCDGIGAIDSCGNIWQYREFRTEPGFDCPVPFCGYLGPETELVPGLTQPEDFDLSFTVPEWPEP